MAAPLRRACLGRLARYKLSNNFNLCQASCPTVHIHTTANRRRSVKQQDDFFGIDEYQKQLKVERNGSEKTVTLTDPEQADAKTRETEMQKILRSLERKSKGELVYQSTFGQVRLDSKAKTKSLYDVEAQSFLQAVSRSSRTASNTDQIIGQQQNNTERKFKKPRGRKARKERDSKTTDRGEHSLSTEPNMNYLDEHYLNRVSETVHVPALSQNVRQERSQSAVLHTNSRFDQQDDEGRSRFMEETASREGCSGQYQTVASREHADNFIDQTYFPSLTTDSAESSPLNNMDNISRGCPNLSSFIDEQYFPHHFQTEEGPASNFQKISASRTELENSQHEQQNPEISHIQSVHQQCGNTSSTDHNEEHSVELPSKELKHIDHNTKTVSQISTELIPALHEDFNFIDEQYFDGDRSTGYASLEDTVADYGVASQEMHGQPADLHETSRYTATDGDTQTTSDFRLHYPTHDHTPDIANQKRKVSSSKEEVKEVENSAYQTAMTMRKNLHLKKDEKEGKSVSDNRGRVQKFKEQVPDLYHMPSMEVAKLLADNLVFENDDFIAVSKPYGLPSHGGPGVHVSVGQVLGPLSHRLDKGCGQLDSLHLVHRLDKETTGVMLLAKNAEVAWQLLGMFRRREVSKTYWTITKGLPQPLEGVIDIPLARKNVNGIYKTVVRPREYVSDGKVKIETWNHRDDNSSAAVTEYKVLAHRDSMALVECRPLTGIQHQIRAHLAQALNAPVLGDHKYSHIDRLAPQKLFPEALQKLGIRQAQVRHVPMHLHAKGLLLPEWRGRTNIFISASIPRFFLRNLKDLKIKIPPK